MVCDSPQFEDGYADTWLNPTVLIEVLRLPLKLMILVASFLIIVKSSHCANI